MSEEDDAIEAWFIRHNIPIGDREELMEHVKDLIRTEKEQAYESGREQGTMEGEDTGYARGYEEGKRNGASREAQRISEAITYHTHLQPMERIRLKQRLDLPP